MNFCVWQRLHSSGCGWVTITSRTTGRSVTAAVTSYCDCYTGTPNERIIDLQTSVVLALGLNPALGLWQVVVELAVAPNRTLLPNTSYSVR